MATRHLSQEGTRAAGPEAVERIGGRTSDFALVGKLCDFSLAGVL